MWKRKAGSCKCLGKEVAMSQTGLGSVESLCLENVPIGLAEDVG